MDHKFSEYIENEIEWLMDIDTEGGEGYTRAEAIKEIETQMEDNGDPSERKYLKEIRLYLISVGVYEVLSEERLAKIQVTSGKKYDFKINGVFYGFKSWEPLNATV